MKRIPTQRCQWLIALGSTTPNRTRSRTEPSGNRISPNGLFRSSECSFVLLFLLFLSFVRFCFWLLLRCCVACVFWPSCAAIAATFSFLFFYTFLLLLFVFSSVVFHITYLCVFKGCKWVSSHTLTRPREKINLDLNKKNKNIRFQVQHVVVL